MKSVIVGTIFCLLFSVTQTFASEKTITVEGLRIFFVLTETNPEIAQKLDANMAAGVRAINYEIQSPQSIDFFNQISRQEVIMDALFGLSPGQESRTLHQLRQLYHAHGRSEAAINQKMSQLRNTEQISLVKEIFAALSLTEEKLLQIADLRNEAKAVVHLRQVLRELIEYTHSYNRELRLAVTRALSEIATEKMFRHGANRFKWKEYYNDVWAEVHPSASASLVRSCFRVLSGH